VNTSFVLVEKITPLQAADIVATETYWHAKSVLVGEPKPRPHMAHFLTRISTEGFMLDEPLIRQTLADHGFAEPE
jgi:hypothetical protein